VNTIKAVAPRILTLAALAVCAGCTSAPKETVVPGETKVSKGGGAGVETQADPFRLPSAPVLDGRLDDACWNEGACLGPMWLHQHKDRKKMLKTPADRVTDVYAGYTEAGLYVAVRCEGASAAKGAHHDDRMIGRGEHVSVYVNCQPDERGQYIVLMANPDGLTFDANHRVPITETNVWQHPRSWEGIWEVATAREGKTWTAEFFLPFASLELDADARPEWDFNVHRQAVWSDARGMTQAVYYSSHPYVRPLPYFRRADLGPGKMGPFRIDLAAFAFPLRPAFVDSGRLLVRVTNRSGAKLRGRLESACTPTGEAADSVRVRLRPDETRRLRLEAPPGERCVVRLKDEQGTVRRQVYADPEAESILRVEACPRYDGGCVFDLFLSEAVEGGRVEAQTDGGRVLLDGRLPAGRTALAVDPEQLAGEREVVFNLNVGRPRVAFSRRVALPAQATELIGRRPVEMDKLERLRLPDGEVFFPMGWFTGDHVVETGIPDLAQLGAAGFNCVVQYGTAVFSPEGVETYLDAARENGIMVVAGINTYSRGVNRWYEATWGAKNGLEPEEALRRVISRVKDHPALLSWYIGDERMDALEELKERFRYVRGLDPGHPVHLIEAFPELNGPYSRACDIVGVDPYFSFARSWRRSRISRAVSRDKDLCPLWVTLNHPYYVPASMNSYEEQRLNVFSALAGGAQGIFLFNFGMRRKRYKADDKEAVLEYTSRIAREVLQFKDVFVLPACEPAFAVSSEQEGIYAGFRSDGRDRFVIMVNLGKGPDRATLSLEGADAVLAPLIGPERVQFDGGKATLELARYGVGVYRIEPPGK